MKTKSPICLFLIICFILVGNRNNCTLAQETSKPAIPRGIGHEFTIEPTSVDFPLPAIEYADNNGDENTRYSLKNPIVELLYGFNSIWALNDNSWQNCEANGSGPGSFENTEIRNSKIWQENIQYVINVTNNRTEAQAMEAYYDDRRDKCYSVIDGFGPLAEAYIKGSGAVTKIDYSNDRDFDVNSEMTTTASDIELSGLGTQSSELSKLTNIVWLLRQRSSASTNGAKYFYSSPRPWRMNDLGEVVPVDENGDSETDIETIDGNNFEKYETSVKVIPALKVCRRVAEDGRRKDGGFPSGHTNAAYLAAIGWAYAVPERFSEFFTRASELGENRVIAGMHSPLDVIGARIQSEVIAAYAFSKGENKSALKDAYENAGEYFGKLADEKGQTLYKFAHANDNSDWADNENNKQIYRERMNYGFSQTNKKGIPPIIPVGAETLLETRQPYLTAAQRRAVLYTTAMESGYPVIDESNGWGRLDYVKAADGYGAFLGDVTVNMDSSKGRFNVHDRWKNNISGVGLLKKEGTGTLTLTGNNSYSGGTLIKNGTLEAKSATAFGSGDVYIQDGKILINSEEPVIFNGSFTMSNGTLTINLDDDSTQIFSKGLAYIEGGNLQLNFSDHALEIGTDLTLISANTLLGEFDKVTTEGYDTTLEYSDTSIVVHINGTTSLGEKRE